MIPEKESDLNFAYHTICQYIIWRQGHTDEECKSSEITKSLSIAAGAIIDYLVCDKSKEMAESFLKRAENALTQQECITISTKQMLDDCKRENRRLKAILASHHIKYKGKRK